MKYRIVNWSQYQHYKDRCPPWIKLHHALLTSEVWVMGTDATRTLAIACMLLASRNSDNDGSFNGDPEYIRRFAYLHAMPDFKQLIEYNFIELAQDASNVLAKCNTEQRQSRDRVEHNLSTSQSNARATEKFQMHVAWKPSDEFPTIAKMAMVTLSDGKLGEFIAHWLTQPLTLRTQAEWDKALLQSIKYDKARAQSPPSKGNLSREKFDEKDYGKGVRQL